MAPNTIEMQDVPVPEIIINGNKPVNQSSAPQRAENYGIKVFQSSLVSFANILVGAILGISYLFAFRNGLPLGSTPMHIVLCVTGYQLLMTQAVLSLSSENGWTSRLTLVNKRRSHWILQIIGSSLAIGGTFHKILDKTSHWDTLHGIFGLVALVFTSVSLVNGLASLYAYELRGLLPGNLSKLTHICFGTVAFVSASVCLCLGMSKSNFVAWSTKPLSDTFIAFVSILTLIVVINPLITFYNKSMTIIKK